MEFRALRADEVECRVARATEKGLALLLYKDARCDMNILDETVGPMNWQRSHSRENANCTVSLWDKEKNQWISKEDTGTESNTEAEKGLASDSFKRACFNWGIGRELYTAPFIWIPAFGKDGKENYRGDERGKPRDRFDVAYMRVEEGRITALAIDNLSLRRSVFTFGDCFPKDSFEEPLEEAREDLQTEAPEPLPQVKRMPIPKYIGPKEKEALLSELRRTGWNLKDMMRYLGKKFPDMPPADLGTITDIQYRFILGALKKKPAKE